ncbi:hypothetical protein [Balneola sp. EhC07]|uniref:hypothetical protein n=1 Tax=Balneola sp. EhC07 TaxID=1849360 RepID=UPI00129022BF|nr:hypothetical protein [Balneola sp. EhC07]
MKKNIRFWEQETKSESGFVYTFGIAIAHFHVGANRDSPLHGIEPNKSSAKHTWKILVDIFCKESVLNLSNCV